MTECPNAPMCHPNDVRKEHCGEEEKKEKDKMKK
jgi:hypothetical protein